MAIDKETFLRRLFLEMERQKLSMKDLTDKAGLNENVIYMWKFSPKTLPSLYALDCVCDALNVSMDYITGRSGKEIPLEKTLTTREAAKREGVSFQMILYAIKKKRLPAEFYRGKWRIKEKDLEEYLSNKYEFKGVRHERQSSETYR